MAVVKIGAGQNIQAMIDANPTGTVFQLDAGVYRQSNIMPKDFQKFIGSGNTVINGSIELKGWTQQGGLWKVGGLPNPLPQDPLAAGGFNTNLSPREDLFIDGALYKRAASIDTLKAGTWFYDAASRSAVISTDPTNHKIELSTAENAFTGNAKGVVLQNLTIEKYASGPQRGAVQSSDDWQVLDSVVRWNHGAGVVIGKNGVVQGGAVVDNGQIGIGGWRADGASIINVEIARNNYANYDKLWDAGGVKFADTKNLKIMGNYVHDNNGNGLWGDINMEGEVVTHNVISNNVMNGVLYEISYSGKITDNYILRNGSNGTGDLFPAQISLHNSATTVVSGNQVEIAPGYGDGIAITYWSETYPATGLYGPYQTRDNQIIDNKITHLGNAGQSGYLPYENTAASLAWTNTWRSNDYVAPSSTYKFFKFGWANNYDWASLVKTGMEAQGTFVQATKAATPIIAGGMGADKLTGSAASEIIIGGNGNDTLSGGGGNDVLIGGRGSNTLDGGAGQDVALFEGAFASYKVSQANGVTTVQSLSGDGARHTVRNVESLQFLDRAVAVAPVATPVSIVVRASGDAYAGAPMMAIIADGKQIGPLSAVSAIHQQGQWQDVTVTLAAGVAAPSKVEVVFTNDGSGPTGDRNLFVDYIDVAGKRLQAEAPSVVYQLDGGGTMAGQEAMAWQGRLVFPTGQTQTASGVLAASASSDGVKAAGTPAQNHAPDPAPQKLVHGTAADDHSTGTDASERFIGRQGEDTFIGKGGDDVYVVNSHGDKVIEAADQGVDTVLLWNKAYALPDNVECLEVRNLTGAMVKGNALDNLIKGGEGADVIQGGSGADLLAGGAGTDRFVYTALGDAGDVIVDFNPKEDKVDLRSLFKAVSDAHVSLVHHDGGVAVMVEHAGESHGLVFLAGLSLESTQPGSVLTAT